MTWAPTSFRSLISAPTHSGPKTGLLCGAIGLCGLPASANDLRFPIGSDYILDGYGQFHFAYQSFDDGRKTTENLVDISNANSRFGFYIEPADGSDGLSFQFETGLGFRPSSKTSQTNTPDFLHWTRRDLRQVQLIYSGGFGTFRLGQGSMPADGAAESDLGGTVVVAKSTIPEANGGYIFRNGAGDLSDLTIKDTFDNLDGDRRFRLRYDTPAYEGVSLAIAYGIEVLTKGVDDDYYEAALRYAGDFHSFEVKGAVSVAFTDTSDEVIQENVGSISVMHKATGLNLQIALGQNDTGPKASYIYLKGGWNTRLTDIGVTKFVAEYFSGNDYVTNGSNSDMWGLAVIQEVEKANIEVYAGYRAFCFDDNSATSYQDADAVQIGMRYRF